MKSLFSIIWMSLEGNWRKSDRNTKWEPSCCGATVLAERPKVSVGKSNQSRSRWTFDRVQKLDTNTVTKLGESHWYKFPSPLQVTTSSLRPSTCRRTISWWSKMTGRPCFPSTYLTNHPPVPTTTMRGRIQWSGSMRFPIRMKGGHCAVLPLPWSHMSYLKTGGLWTDCGWSFSYVYVLWVLLAVQLCTIIKYLNLSFPCRYCVVYLLP